MHDHNLDDLIIGSIEPGNSKTKSFLTIIALLIVVMIVAIILTRTILKTPTNQELILEENITELIAPELKLQEVTMKTEKEPSLSNILDSEISTPAPEIKDIVANEEPKVPLKESLPIVDTVEEDIEIPYVQPENALETEETEVIIEEKKKEKVIKEIVPITQEYTHIPKKVKKPVQKIIAPTPVKKPTKLPDVAKTIPLQTYYIQVGSFTQDPSTRFLSVIKNSGFNYTISKTASDGSKKLLIGPYQNKKSVDSALIQVKDRINKSAFVIKR